MSFESLAGSVCRLAATDANESALLTRVLGFAGSSSPDQPQHLIHVAPRNRSRSSGVVPVSSS